MAAGLGFKDFTTGEVLTAADVDGYLMQGVWVFASATARDAAVTSPQEGNFAYLKDTNVTTYYTGSAWANLDTTGMTNPMTTTGDIIYSSSGSTPARLGIGSTGNVLTVAGGVPSWAAPAAGGAYTLLSTTTLTTASTTITTPTSGYKDLYFLIYGTTGVAGNMRLRPNNVTTAGDMYFAGGPTGAASHANYYNSQIELQQNDVLGSGAANYTYVYIRDYLDTSSFKQFNSQSNYIRSSNSAKTMDSLNGYITDLTALTTIVFINTSGAYTAGTLLTYGVK